LEISGFGHPAILRRNTRWLLADLFGASGEDFADQIVHLRLRCTQNCTTPVIFSLAAAGSRSESLRPRSNRCDDVINSVIVQFDITDQTPPAAWLTGVAVAGRYASRYFGLFDNRGLMPELARPTAD
jgi:hypothetical protein